MLLRVVAIGSGAGRRCRGSLTSWLLWTRMMKRRKRKAKTLRVFVDDVVESSEVTSGITRIGNYALHDLVLLDDNSFGVVIRLESEAFQVLKDVPERPDVALVRLREIKFKIDKKNFAKDRYNNTLSVKDVVKILEGPCRGKQGPVEHIYKGILFVYDRRHLEHTGFICVKSESCMMVGGSPANGDRSVWISN